MAVSKFRYLSPLVDYVTFFLSRRGSGIRSGRRLGQTADIFACRLLRLFCISIRNFPAAENRAKIRRRRRRAKPERAGRLFGSALKESLSNRRSDKENYSHQGSYKNVMPPF